MPSRTPCVCLPRPSEPWGLSPRWFIRSVCALRRSADESRRPCTPCVCLPCPCEPWVYPLGGPIRSACTSRRDCRTNRAHPILSACLPCPSEPWGLSPRWSIRSACAPRRDRRTNRAHPILSACLPCPSEPWGFIPSVVHPFGVRAAARSSDESRRRALHASVCRVLASRGVYPLGGPSVRRARRGATVEMCVASLHRRVCHVLASRGVYPLGVRTDSRERRCLQPHSIEPAAHTSTEMNRHDRRYGAHVRSAVLLLTGVQPPWG